MREPHSGPTGPLAGYRILDLSAAYTGPFATALLADQGADVIKVERPGTGDMTRWLGAGANGVTALYQLGNRGKRSVALDLASDEGRDAVLGLAQRVDVVVQNFRPGAIERLGLGYDEVCKVNDEIVYVSISGFGSTGPHGDRAAMDHVIQAYAGIAMNESPDGERPRFLDQAVVDKLTAFVTMQAITAALLARERGRGGQHVHVSMLDAAVTFLWPDCAGNETMLDAPGDVPSKLVNGFNGFACRDGWVIAMPANQRASVSMAAALGVDGHDDPRLATETDWLANGAVAGDLLARSFERMRELDAAEVVARLRDAGVPCSEIQSAAQLVDDPHAREIGLFVESTHPVAGRLRQPRHPIIFDGTPAQLGTPAPALGEHTDEVLQELNRPIPSEER
jgi:crotonobetainyl-CoA:carnitine CoA-transferase CaiB-like acyl-CoA transferase